MEPIEVSDHVEEAAKVIISRLDRHPFKVGEQILISADTAICAILLASFVTDILEHQKATN